MAILATEKVPTLDYWKQAYQLKVGDYVFDRKGQIVQVKLVQEYRATNCYRVRFCDSLSVSGDENLAFQSETHSYRNHISKYKQVQRFRYKLLHLKVKNLIGQPLKHYENAYKHSLATTNPLEFPHQELPVPPFIFGFWFFNRKANKRCTPAKGLREETHQEFKDAGYKLRERWTSESGEKEFEISPSIESHLGFDIPRKIPNNYLMSAPEQRIALLRGIMFAKHGQYNPKTDRFRFTSKFYSLVQQVQYLAESLGCRTTILNNPRWGNYTLFFKCKHRLMPNQTSGPLKVHPGRRFIRAIEEIPPQACVYVETTAPDNTLLVGEGFIATC